MSAKKLAVVMALLGSAAAMVGAQAPLANLWAYTPVNTVNAVAYSPNGKLLAIGGYYGVQILDAATRTLLHCLPSASTGATYALAWDKNSEALAVGGNNTFGTNPGPSLEIWNAVTGVMERALPSNASGYPAVAALAFTQDGTSLVEGGGDSVLEMWSVSTGKLTATFKTAARNITSVAVSPDGKTLADGGGQLNGGQALELWSLSTGKLLKSLPTAAEPVMSVAFSPDGTKLVSAGYTYNGLQNLYSSVLELWGVSNESLIQTLENTPNTVLSAAAFSPDGKTLADGGYTYSGSTKGFLERWSVTGWKQSAPLPTISSQVVSVAFSPTSSVLADGGIPYSGYITNAPDIMEFWQLPAGTLIENLDTAAYTQTSGAAFSPDGKTLAQAAAGLYSSNIASFSGIVNLWNVATGVQTGTLQSSADQGVGAVAYSPDGKLLVDGGSNFNVAKNSYTGILEVWNTATGKLAFTLPTQCANGMHLLVFSPDSKMLAAAGLLYDPQIGANVSVLELWSVPNQKLIGYVLGQATASVVGVGFTPDSKTMMVGGTKFVSSSGDSSAVLEIWDLTSGKGAELATQLFSEASAALSPNGKTICATGTEGPAGEMELWDVPSASLKATIPLGSNYGAQGEAYSADGNLLFLGLGADLVLFSADTYEQVGSYSEYGGAYGGPTSLTVSPDGSRVAYTETPSIFIAPNPFLGMKVTGLTIAPTSVEGATAVKATVTLSDPAPTGGAVVTLTSNSSAVTGRSLTIGAGAKSGSVTLATLAVAASTPVTVSAHYIGTPATAKVTVTPPVLESLSLSATTVVGSSTQSVTGTVTLSGPAPAGGSVVTLKSTKAAAASGPATVTVAAGAKSATFKVAHSKVTVQTAVTITASFDGVNKAANLTVTP
jgi:WD40 repeat protein